MASYPPNPHAPLTILLVDDEEAMRKAIKWMLELLGFSVIECCDGHRAVLLVQLEEPKFELVISDFRMPGIDGVETLKALEKMRPGMKSILCSGALEEDCLQGRALEGTVYLGKPFGLQALNSAVNRALG